MLKNCIVPSQYNNLTNKTCGEIVCQSETSFTIICKVCNLKVFEFNEFVQHFRNTHWNGIKTIANISNQFNVNEENFHVDNENDGAIKAEVYVTEEVLYEEYHLDEPVNEQDTSSDIDEWSLEKDGEQSNEEGDSYDMEETIAILKKKIKTSKKKEHQLKCPFCKRSFTNKSFYETHVQKHESFQLKCDKCSKFFANETQLVQHQDRHNGHRCLVCNKFFEKYDSLRFHKETHIQTKNFVCDYKDCTKAFPTQRRLNSHKHLHYLEAKFVCEICGSRHRNKKALTDHIRYHSGEMFICEECGYKCRRRESLIVHKRHHTGEKPFGCKLCDRHFGSKPLLNEHMASHEKERKHICDVCGKSFNRPKALYHHKHLHLGVKKFVCKMCGQAYAQAAGLSAHMRKHREDTASFATMAQFKP